MEPIIAKFEFISDVSDEIDRLVDKAKKTADRQQKKVILEKARELIVAYEKHVGRKIFNHI